MTATNHVLTGSLFTAITIGQLPLWLILPLAFLLHFVLDSLPHFGEPNNQSAALNRLKWLLPVDASVAAAVLITILVTQPVHWPWLLLGGVLCASPDLWSAPRFFRFLRSGATIRNSDWFARFHSRIQWGERLWGAWVEVIWFAAGIVLLWQFL